MSNGTKSKSAYGLHTQSSLVVSVNVTFVRAIGELNPRSKRREGRTMWTHNATPRDWALKKYFDGYIIRSSNDSYVGEIRADPEFHEADAMMLVSAKRMFEALAREADLLRNSILWLRHIEPDTHGSECNCSSCSRYREIVAVLQAAGGEEG